MSNNFYGDASERYPIKEVKIDTVDRAVYDYFNKKLSPTIERDAGLEGQESYKVPVFYAGAERWVQARQNNYRDEHGTLILPVISIRRMDIDREPGFGGMAQEVRAVTVSKIIHPKTSNIQNLVEKRKTNGFFFQPERPPIIEYTTIPFPDFAQILYKISIWTQYTQHMNEILEKIFYKYELLDSFVMPVEYDGNHPKGNSFYFVGFREGMISKESNDENFTDQERVIKYTYNIRVPVYFLLNPDDEATSRGRNADGTKSVYKKQSSNQIKFKEEVLSLEEFEKLYG